MAYRDLDRPPLDVRALRRALRVGEAGSWWQAADVVATTASTNADLVARAGDGAAEGAVLVAEHQSAGRGRLDRVWEAPPSAALTWSVLVRPEVAAARWPWLPLLAGTALAEAVSRAAGVGAGLKWPNDVVVADRKLAGVLVERIETPRGPAAVIGTGLNVSQHAEELPLTTATSLLLEIGAVPDRQPLLLAVLRGFERLYRAWVAEEGDSRGLHPAYVRRCTTLGRTVRVDLPDGEVVQGSAESVDADGRLVIAAPGGRRTVGAGEVVHVRPVV